MDDDFRRREAVSSLNGPAPAVALRRRWAGRPAGLLVSCVVAASSAGLLASARGPQDPPGAAADRPDGPVRPKVVQVDPPPGAEGVDPVTEIRIRFDRPMDPSRAHLEWDFREPAGYRLRGPLRYDEATRTFVLPVRLTPGATHRITTGEARGGPRRPEGFESAEDVVAEMFSWSFTTAKAVTVAGAEPPRLVGVDPPPDTQVALLTPLRLAFDRPMDPASYALAHADPADSLRRIELYGEPEYDPERHALTIMLKLPANWNGEVRLVGFRSAEGGEAAPIVLPYRTLREPLAGPLRAKIERAGQDDAGLRRFLERVREARRARDGLRVDVLTTMSFPMASPSWHQRYDTTGATFAVQGDRLFYGEIDEVMGTPFRVGCDGVTCWFHRQGELVAVPFEEFPERNVLVGDPFGASGLADVSEVIRDRKLDDLGEAALLGRPCRRIRSWDVRIVGGDLFTTPIDWWIDGETLLPIRADAGHLVMDFAYAPGDRPIPDDLFHPPGLNVRKADPGPLPEGYVHRFLNVIDGSNGRMSIRWGMKGPKGTTGSGLN